MCCMFFVRSFNPEIVPTQLMINFVCHLNLSLRKLAYAINRVFSALKIETFRLKFFVIFLIFAQKHRLWVLVRTALAYFSYFCSKHRLWVHVRTASLSLAVLTSTHNLCFGAKIRKKVIPLHTPVLLYKSGV